MKQAITPDYTFTPASKQINLSGISGFDIKRLYAIINVTANQVIYATGQSSFGLSGITGNLLTLTFDTTSMNANDELMIIYDTADSDELLSTLTSSLDFFGNQSISYRTNQIEVDLNSASFLDFVDETVTATGFASASNGVLNLSTGADPNGGYALISKDPVRYRPNSEIGWGFTFCFPTGSVAGVASRIGVTSDIATWNDAVYFSHTDGVFSLVYRNNGVEVFNVEPSAWVDPCDGSAGSMYMDKNGASVALDTTKDQLARVRAGLFGHAGFLVEILTPGQKWLPIYYYSAVNATDAAVFSQFNLKIGAEINKTAAGATNYRLSSACWAGWTGADSIRMNDPISDRSLTKLTRTVIEGKSTVGGGTYVPVKVTPSGAVSVEGSVSLIKDPNELNQISFRDETKDAFGRLVTVNPKVIGAYDFKNSIEPAYFDQVIEGAASVTHNATRACLELTATAVAGDEAEVQSFRSMEYIRGTGQLFLFSLNPGGDAIVNNHRYWGCGDDTNGAFWGVDGAMPGTGLHIMIRDDLTGVVNTDMIGQADFNLDTLDGNGPSGITLDTSLQNLFFIEYSWLGTNVVKFGIEINGQKIIAHQHNFANVSDRGWCRSGNLPFYFENSNDPLLAPATASTLRVTCCSCVSFGEYSNNQPKRWVTDVNSGLTAISFGTTPIIGAGIRLRPDKKFISASPSAFEILPISGNNVMRWQIIVDPTIVGGTYVNYDEYTQILTGYTSFSGGRVIKSGYLNLVSAGRLQSGIAVDIADYIGYYYDGTPQDLIIVIETVASTGEIYFAGQLEIIE